MKIPNIYKEGFYKALAGSGKVRKRDILDNNENMLLMIAACEHEYDTPDFNKYFYELAIRTGCAAFYKCTAEGSVNKGKWCCTPAKPAGTINNMMISEKITTVGSDYSLELTVDKDCILIYNNSSLYPDMLSAIIAEDLTETAISASKLTKWARMTPIPKAKNDTDVAKMQTLLQRILDGEDINVVSEKLNMLEEGHQTIDDNVLRLTDESAVEKLHFFDQHYDQLLKRYATMRGLPFATTAKNAQALMDELHDMDVFSTFLIRDEIACREEGFRRAEAFMKSKGEDFSFKYRPAELLRKQLERPAVEFEAEASEALRIKSEASEKVSQGIREEAEAEKFLAEAEKLEAEAEQTEAQTEEAEELSEEAEAQTDEDTEKEGDLNDESSESE